MLNQKKRQREEIIKRNTEGKVRKKNILNIFLLYLICLLDKIIDYIIIVTCLVMEKN